MDMMRRIAAGACLLACCASAGWGADSGAPKAAPDWVARGSHKEGDALYAVGQGMSRVDALASALGELAKESRIQIANDQTPYPAPSQTVLSTSSVRFGGVAVSSLGKAFTDHDRQQVSESVTVETKTASGSFMIKTYLSATNTAKNPLSDEESSLQVFGANMRFSDLLAELARAGVRMKVYEDSDGTFVGLSYKTDM
jgi:hypothetical protein